MSTTINISLPKAMYEDAKKFIKAKKFTSMSELIRDALRGKLYPELTENGFTPEFEDLVLQSAREPVEKAREWNGKTPFSDFVLSKGKKYAKDTIHSSVPRMVSETDKKATRVRSRNRPSGKVVSEKSGIHASL